MNLNTKLLLVSFCAVAVLVAIGVVGSQIMITAEENKIGASIASSGVIVYPEDSGQDNMISGESPALAINQQWTVLDLGEGNIKQVEITVRTTGYIDVIAYSGGNKVESIRVSEYGILTFQCYKIEFKNGYSYEYDDQRIVSYDYVII